MFENFVGGRWLAPAEKRYLVMPRHSSGVRACRVARSSAEDVDQALDHAQRARQAWSDLATEERAAALGRIADRIGDHGFMLGLADCWDRGESVFAVSQHVAEEVLESLTEPLYRQLAEFQGEGRQSPPRAVVSNVVKVAFAADTEIDAMCRRVVPLILEGHAAVIVLLYRGDRRLPVRLLALMGIMAECLPPGVLNLVTGLGLEAGVALVNSTRAVASSELSFPAARTADRIAARLDRKQAI